MDRSFNCKKCGYTRALIEDERTPLMCPECGEDNRRWDFSEFLPNPVKKMLD